MAALTKDDIKGLKASAVKVPIEGFGDVFIRVMSGSERDSLEASCIKTRGKVQEENRDNFRAKILVRTLSDEHGVRMFKDDEAGVVGSLPATFVVPAADEAATINKMNKKDVDSLTKNSEAGQKDDSGSDSPAG